MGVASSSQSSQSASQLNHKTPPPSDFSDSTEHVHEVPCMEEQHFSGPGSNLNASEANSTVVHQTAHDQSALRFHEVCGKNIEFLNGKRMAKRKEDHFCDAIVFSHRPIGVYERVYVKVIKLSTFWNGMIRFGFTSVNPETMNPASRRAMSLGSGARGHQQPGRMDSLNGSHSSSLGESHSSHTANSQPSSSSVDEADDLSSLELPKYVYPDLTNKEGYWAASMAENSIHENDVLYFYVNTNGEIHYGINDKYQGLFLDGIDVYKNRPRNAQPLWAIFDIYGNTIAIEFVQSVINKYQNNSHSSSSQQYVKQTNQTTAVVMNTFDCLPTQSTAATNYGEQVSSNNNNYRTLTSINSLGSTGSSIRSTGSSIQVSTTSSSNPSSTLSSISSSNVVPRSSQLVTATAVSSRGGSRAFEHNAAAGSNDMRYLAKVISSAGQASTTQAQASSSTTANDAEDQLDQLLISCRRLCVDNHLNETLHNSLVQLQNPVASVTSTPPTSTATAFSSPPAPVTTGGGGGGGGGRSCGGGGVTSAISNPPATSTPTLSSTFEPNLTSSTQSNELTHMIRRVYESIPILLHEPITCSRTIKNKFLTAIHGRNVKISQPDRLIAYRPSSLLSLTDRLTSSSSSSSSSSSASSLAGPGAFKKPTTNAYVFLETPLERGQSFCIQIVGLDQSAHESSFSLGIGCTTCVPATLNQQIDLPDDADELVDRAEYWVVYKNLFTSNGLNANGVASADHRMHAVSIADELCFRLEDSSCGNVNFYINGRLKTKCLFSVDVTQKLWFFFDLCGRTSAIRLIPSCSNMSSISSGNLSSAAISTIQVRQSPDAEHSPQRRARPNSALIDYFKNQILFNHNAASASGASDLGPSSRGSGSGSNASDSPVSTTTTSGAKSEATSSSSGNSVSQQEECRICWEAPIECVFYSCGHMCLCWNCASKLKKQANKMSASAVTSTDPTKKLNKYPLCPICRMEIIDIIRFFKS